MTVAVLTDSAASLPAAAVEEHHITVVPLHLLFDGQDLKDGEAAFSAVVDRITADPKSVTTSAPSPGEFLAAMAAAPDADELAVVTVASHMSAAYKSAWSASSLCPRPVRVIDSGTAAGAEGLVVLAAAEAAAMGQSLDAVEARALEVAERVELVAAVNGIEHLSRSGRVTGPAGWAGKRLGLHPLFAFRPGGRIVPLRPAQSRSAALERLLTRWRRSRPKQPARLRVAAVHAEAPAEAEALLARIAAEAAPELSFVGQFSPVMVTHTGPGLVGVAWWWEAVDR
jgi:DegV family protein with EDD domain